MLKSIFETAKLIFTSEEIIDEVTRNNHLKSEKIMFRNLHEISSKHKLTGVYKLNEYPSATKAGEVQYEFEEVSRDIAISIEKSFKESLGTLYFIDEERKSTINENFSLKEDWLYSQVKNKTTLISSPDFVYKLGEEYFWVTLAQVRNEVSENNHTEILDILYRALFNADQIKINMNFETTEIKEKYYNLVHFRLDRYSLFLVLRDKENREIYHTREFKYISSIEYQDEGSQLRFWLYMLDIQCRFFVPYKKEDLFAEHLQVDPIIHRM